MVDKKSISRGAFNKTLDKLELRDIYLVESHSKTFDQFQARELEIITNSEIDAETDGDILTIFYHQNLAAKGKDKKKPYLTFSARYKVTFEVKPKAEISEEFLDTFTQVILDTIVWPYYRELVQSMISKMNLPLLTLPMSRPPIP